MRYRFFGVCYVEVYVGVCVGILYCTCVCVCDVYVNLCSHSMHLVISCICPSCNAPSIDLYEQAESTKHAVVHGVCYTGVS